MKDGSIVFNWADMEAVMDGRKTLEFKRIEDEHRFNGPYHIFQRSDGILDSYGKFLPCLHGAVGDVLWVRESYRAETVTYRGGKSRVHMANAWKSPLMMQKWMSRARVKLIELEVHRLQSTSDEELERLALARSEFMERWKDFYERNSPVWAISFRRM